MLEAIDLCKRYNNGVLALDALNLKAEAGEIYVLLGAPAAGKSTAVRLFLGFTRPTSGRTLVHGIDVAQHPMESRQHLAYLRGNSVFYEGLSALENLRFFARLGGRNDHRESLMMALREARLPERMFGEKVELFEPSMRQKLGLAIMLVKDAPGLLLDEPTAGLDPHSTAEILDLLLQLRERQKAILIATESPFVAKHLADRLSVLNEGRQVLSLTRKELVYQDLEALYRDHIGGLRPRRRG